MRDELRGRLRVVLASRMTLMDAEQARLEQEIAAFAEKIASGAAEIGTMEASQHSLTERGYELDREGQDAQNRANSARCGTGTCSGAGTQQCGARDGT